MSPVRLLKQWIDDPFRRADNAAAVLNDANGWRLASRIGLLVVGVVVAAGLVQPSALPLAGYHALLCEAAAYVALRQPSVYASYREAIALVGWLHQAWMQTEIALRSNFTVQLEGTRAPLLALLLCIRNGALYMMAYALNARLTTWCNCLWLPLVVAGPVWRSEAVCRRSLLPLPGIAAPLARLYQGLARLHMLTAPLGTAAWQLDVTDPLQACWMVNTYLLLMLVVALPLLLMWPLECRARWRFAAPQQEQQRQQKQEGQGRQGRQERAHRPPATAPAAGRHALSDHPPGNGGLDAVQSAEAAAELQAGAAPAPAAGPEPVPACGLPTCQLGGSLEADGCGSEARLCSPQSWMVRWDAWEVAAAARPRWAWLLDAYLASCAIWAALSYCASRRTAG